MLAGSQTMDGRIVVTGIGAVTPLGMGRAELWENLLAGRCAFAPVTSFDTRAFNVHLGAEVRGFSPAACVRTLEPAALGRASQLAIAAARLALADAGLDPDGLAADERERAGVAMGTTSGEPLEVERFDDRYLAGELARVGGEFMERYPCHLIAAHLAAELGLGGLNVMLPAACAAGNYALAYALDALRAGRAELMLAGGADAFSRITYTGVARHADQRPPGGAGGRAGVRRRDSHPDQLGQVDARAHHGRCLGDRGGGLRPGDRHRLHPADHQPGGAGRRPRLRPQPGPRAARNRGDEQRLCLWRQ